MRLEILHPEVSGIPCEHCLKFLRDEKTWRPIRRLLSGGKYGSCIRRTEQNPAPCRLHAAAPQLHPPCPKGTPERQRDLSAKNRRAYRHYLMCSALGSWPNDGIVRRNAGIIRLAETQAENLRRWEGEKILNLKLDGISKMLAKAMELRAL